MHDIVTKIIESKLPFGETLKRLRRHRMAVVGAMIIFGLILIAFAAPFFAPHDPLKQNLARRLLPDVVTTIYAILTGPAEQSFFAQLLQLNLEFPLGTDNLGRCILSRLIFGTRVSLQAAVMVVSITSVVGTMLGVIAGYYGGIIDEIIMRIIDVLLAFPGIILALVIAGILGPSLFNLMLMMVLIGWTGYARVVRGAVLAVKEKEFIEAARAAGISDRRIIWRHVLPNVMAPVIVMSTLGMAHIILAVAGLSFLGLGAQPPVPEWGSMLNAGRAFMRTAPHLTIFPGLVIMLTVLAFNFLGDGLRDALDPWVRN